MCYEVAREQYSATMLLYTVAAYYKQIKSADDFKKPWVAKLSTFYTILGLLGLKSTALTSNAVQDKANVI